MIQIAGEPFQQSSMWPTGGIERAIIQRMNNNPTVYSYSSVDELSFELSLRKNIVLSARAMNQSNVQFAVFENSRCNPQYWLLTNTGGFQLRQGIKPSDAIQDIYSNSSLYAFECATAMIIIYYHAVLSLIGEQLFNQFFQNIYLYSWHADPDLGLTSYDTHYFLPGDVVYFNNPDFDPQTPQWRGENAVVLEDGTYFGHGIAIGTAEQMIQTLNQARKPGSNQSAYLMNRTTRPSFDHLAKIAMGQRSYSYYKSQHMIVHHSKNSISFDQYLLLLYTMYNHIS